MGTLIDDLFDKYDVRCKDDEIECMKHLISSATYFRERTGNQMPPSMLARQAATMLRLLEGIDHHIEEHLEGLYAKPAAGEVRLLAGKLMVDVMFVRGYLP